MKVIAPALLFFSLWNEYRSIMWSIGCYFFNNFSLLKLVVSFPDFLFLLTVIFKLSKFKDQNLDFSVSGTVNIKSENY